MCAVKHILKRLLIVLQAYREADMVVSLCDLCPAKEMARCSCMRVLWRHEASKLAACTCRVTMILPRPCLIQTSRARMQMRLLPTRSLSGTLLPKRGKTLMQGVALLAVIPIISVESQELPCCCS